MPITRLSVAAANARANATVDLLDAGAGPGTIQIRTGAPPASVATAVTGTLLATLTLSDPAFGDASSQTATANAIAGDTSADATGTAGWFRAFDSNGVAVIDGDITATSGGGAMELDTVSVIAGGAVNISSWTYTELIS